MPTALPDDSGPALMQLVRDGLPLPEEGRPFPLGSGSLDGIRGRHGRELTSELASEERDRRVAARRHERDQLSASLRNLAASGSAADRAAVYDWARAGDLLAVVDEVLDELRAEPELWPAMALHARWFVDESRHREPLKLGLALLGVVGDASDLSRFRTLARHPDFGLYGIVALVGVIADPADELWAIAREAGGWRKIHAVERLAPLAAGRPDLQRWLLIDGWTDAIVDEYLAYSCATGGRLAAALAGDVDDQLLDAACGIVRALIAGGPGKPLSDYVDGPEATAALLTQLATRCDRLSRLEVVAMLREWLEPDGGLAAAGAHWPSRDELVGSCNAIVREPSWEAKVIAAFDDGTPHGERLGWRLAEMLDLDLWEPLFERLQANQLRAERVSNLARTANTADRRRRLVAWGEAELPLDRIANGEINEKGHSLRDEYQATCAFLRKEPEWQGQLSPKVLVAAMDSGHPTLRILAARALKATPPQSWGTAVEAAARLAATDEREKVRREFKSLFPDELETRAEE